jgi:tetratricopeptide (TPR) repeat protein
VYALGAILYELLTGRPPFKAATSLDTLRQVLDDHPAPPRRLQSGVPRDLETICLKCLHKQPARRYVSAGTLADDQERFLQGRPIQARPVSAAEHAWRWCGRNRAVASLAAALVLALVGGSVVSAFQWRRAVAGERQALSHLHDAVGAREAAEQKEQEALQLLAESVALLSRHHPLSTLKRPSRPLHFLNQAEARYQALLDKQPGNLPLQRGLAEVYYARANLLFSGGDRASAGPDLEKALALWGPLVQADATNRDFRYRLAMTQHYLGCVKEGQGRPSQAVRLFREAHALYQGLNAEEPSLQAQIAVMSNAVALGRALAAAGHVEESLRVVGEVRSLIGSPGRAGEARPVDAFPATVRGLSALLTRFGDHPPGDPAIRERLVPELILTCIVLRQLGAHAEAVRLGESAVRISQEETEAEPDRAAHHTNLSNAWLALGKARWSLGQREQALAGLRQAVVKQRHLFEKEPLVAEHRLYLSKRYGTLVHFLLLSGKLAEAEGCFLEQEKLWPQDTDRLREVALDLRKLADAVGGGRTSLSPAERAERQRYLAQSERVARKAEGLARPGKKAAGGASLPAE